MLKRTYNSTYLCHHSANHRSLPDALKSAMIAWGRDVEKAPLSSPWQSVLRYVLKQLLAWCLPILCIMTKWTSSGQSESFSAETLTVNSQESAYQKPSSRTYQERHIVDPLHDTDPSPVIPRNYPASSHTLPSSPLILKLKHIPARSPLPWQSGFHLCSNVG